MTVLTKPTLANGVWADRGETIAPSDLKIARGWVVEIPPHQQFNWWMKRVDSFLAHSNQRGVPAWDAATQYYSRLSYVTGPTNGLVYRAIQDSKNVNPETNTTAWEPAFMRRADAYTKQEIDAFRTADRTYVDSTFLKINSNLADVPDKPAARANLGVLSDVENTAKFLEVSKNLADVANKATARSNLDVYSKNESDLTYLAITKNLADVPNTTTARSNLGLGDSATKNVGIFPGQVAAGDDPRIVNSVQNTRIVRAGYGMRGGGRLNQDIVVELGTPSTISLTTGNSMWGDTHTHALNLDMSKFFPTRWENVTGARANGGTYWNTSGKMMFVACTSGVTPDQADMVFTVNGEEIYTTCADMGESGGRTGGQIMVPPGVSYSVWSNLGITRWMETR